MLYLAATAIGMLSSWTFYARFGVDIFQFADVGDFLLMAIRTPLASVAILVAAPVVLLIVRSDRWLRQRFSVFNSGWLRWGGRWGHHPLAYFLYFALYAWAFASLYANWRIDRLRDGAEGTLVEIRYHAEALGRGEWTLDTARVLGGTGRFLFLYDGTSDRVTVVPTEHVVGLTPR